MLQSLERCNVLCSHALTLASPLAEKGRSTSLMNSNLSQELFHRVREFKAEAKKLPRTPRRSHVLRVAKAIERCLFKLGREAFDNPKVSLVHGFTLLYLLTGIEYLLIAEHFGFDPPGHREISSLSKLTYPLERLDLRIALPSSLEECPEFLMKEMKHHLAFSWSTTMKFYESQEQNPPEKPSTT
jgi:hypothetical protein